MINKSKITKALIFFSFAFLFVSCKSYKNLPYVKDAEALTQEQLSASAHMFEAKIMPSDVLIVTVNSLAPGVKDFNLPLVPNNLNQPVQTNVTMTSENSGSLQNYIVNSDGVIKIPTLGEVKIGGLTKSQAEGYIASLIYPKYLNEKPIVNIRFVDYKITVNGEVAKPGTYTIANERVTIFEALAKAGDLTVYGKRDNVKLIRMDETGKLNVHIVDLQDPNILLNKDIYYLQQNDNLIVETNKAKGNSSSWGSIESIALSTSLSAISILISVISLTTR
ncbi:hypothetical protein D0T53_04795 [Dysgonomonas sp. 216]|uniref:polysaccharide biosynthesis/export family protein n=1 Tax=Dysgonomonas sp. 216 TaxID=2302934 RepID=UPI0013D76198|nr:polysaccharide biosynthesis/export family protein [Dysgonomonas sp. 216]NDW18237.1 hypothetical protein [Dysgonomonas sp. 216]